MVNRPSFATGVRNVASERDFYTFVNDKTGKVDYRGFEAGLNQSETMLRESLREHVHGGPTSTAILKQRIALGVGFQMTRTSNYSGRGFGATSVQGHQGARRASDAP
jgi:hypothetical protein